LVHANRNPRDHVPAPSTASAPLREDVHRFLEAPGRFAVLATIDPDGSPHQAVAWYLLDGDTIVVNSAEGRRWPANLRRDPRLTFTIEDGYHYVTVRGTVEVVDDQERAHADINTMARSYNADDPEGAERLIRDTFDKQHRISFRLQPERVAVHED
jgi:PPOX class probable F420-dependent enzyme